MVHRIKKRGRAMRDDCAWVCNCLFLGGRLMLEAAIIINFLTLLLFDVA
jgi:hypothetical protein